jgi:hypothetical protein
VPGSIVVAYDRVEPALERRRLVAARAPARAPASEAAHELVESAA